MLRGSSGVLLVGFGLGSVEIAIFVVGFVCVMISGVHCDCGSEQVSRMSQSVVVIRVMLTRDVFPKRKKTNHANPHATTTSPSHNIGTPKTYPHDATRLLRKMNTMVS